MWQDYAQAVVFTLLGFAAGWLGGTRSAATEYARQHRQKASTPACSLNQLATSFSNMPKPVISNPGVQSRQQFAQKPASQQDSLLTRIYPLHEDSMAWESLPLSKYHVILVTGPQRSGTTWAACALASTLDFTLYDERHPLTAGNDTLVSLQRAFTVARQQERGAVIQAPMATSILHKLPIFPGLAILFIARHCFDVFRSQNRVMPHRGGWTCVAGRTRELRKYRRRPELRPHFDERDMICTIKQHVWQRFQKPELQRRVQAKARAPWDEQRRKALSYSETSVLSATVDFASFRSHPLWQEETQRRNLSIKSTAGSHCARLVAESTPRRSAAHVRQWEITIAAAEAKERAQAGLSS